MPFINYSDFFLFRIFFSGLIIDSFKFRNAGREEINKILIIIDPNKTYRIDEIPGRFLKDGTDL